MQLSQSNPGLDRLRKGEKEKIFNPLGGLSLETEQPEQQKKGILGSAVAVKG